MRYVSTRGEAPELGFSDALLTGLARDGGLYVPKAWPHFSKKEIRALRGKSYQEIALAVLTPFAGKDIAEADLKDMIDSAYATFKHPAVAPIVQRPIPSSSNSSTARRSPSRTSQCSSSPG